MTKVLIISPAWVGDLVMSQVLLKILKQQGECLIDVLAPPWGQALLKRMPEVRKVHSLPFGHGQFEFAKRCKLGRSLIRENYDQAIVLPNSWKSAIIPFAARISQRTGWLGEYRWGLLNDARRLDKNKYPLMIQRFAALAFSPADHLPEVLPYPLLNTAPELINEAVAKFALDRNKNILAICPGAEYGPAKRWPAAYYAEIANQHLRKGWDVWLFGGAKDQLIAAEIQKKTANGCKDLIGKTNLGEAVDLLSLANLVITNDSGLMHIAAALDRPIIAIYGSSSPQFTPPLSKQVKIASLNLPCSPCFKRECPLGHLKCLQDLTPDKVLCE